ncbi:MAG: hypothetical protein FWH02_08955, partial [Oscillospiraceae bacterium]|nr:hypothetical protein [Oscillospiraceae bacterium]
MLKVPKLDDLSYEELVLRARSRIPMYTDSWTDFNDHDPGVTTLQTLAWLTDTLNYYTDATGEAHRLKYLKLLGLVPERGAARCLAAVRGAGENLAMARGAKLAAGEIVFETLESRAEALNNVKAIFLEKGGVFTDLTPIAGVDGGYAPLFTPAEKTGQTVYIGFERELAAETGFYAESPIHAARNPFEGDLELSKLAWEFFDGERWHAAAMRQDATCGFLKSGFISLYLDGKTDAPENHPILPKAHYLRARLLRNEYDACPKIGCIHINCVQTVQTETCAQSLEIVFDGSPFLNVDYHVRENDVICVAVEEGDGYSLWFEHVLHEDSLCEVTAGAHPWQRVVCFDKERFGSFPDVGKKILVTITETDAYDLLQLGVTTGFASDRMEIDIANLYELKLVLAGEKDGRPFLRIWNECICLSAQGCDAQSFELNRATGEITFGDGICGVQPEAGLQVAAITAKTSILSGGNIRAGRLDRFLDNAHAELSVRNIEDAEGGVNPKTSQELESEIEGKIYKTSRAVNTQDYIGIVKATPGLMIDCANVISGGEYARFYGGGGLAATVILAGKAFFG